MLKTKKINILGIEINLIKKINIKKILKNILLSKQQLFITTPNPEIVLLANQNEELHYILNQADLSIADGVGLKFAGLLMGKNIPRWSGSEITTYLLDLANNQHYKVAILNWRLGLSSKHEIEKTLKERYPELQFVINNIDKEWSLNYYQKINAFQPDILFVALGSPYQEKFIYKNLHKMPFVKIAIGVGGSFDYLTGKITPAPQLIKTIGLEWLWRLINLYNFSFPIKRLQRISRAIIIFPLKFLKWYFINPHFYRQNVVCFLYREKNNKFEVLLLKRKGENNHWQLPQGGVDKESLEIAGTRELQEETGTYKFKPQKTFTNLYKYQFPDKTNRYFRNYLGQNQGLLLAEYYGDSHDIKLNYYEYTDWQWVNITELVKTVYPNRQKSTNLFLNKFKEFKNLK